MPTEAAATPDSVPQAPPLQAKIFRAAMLLATALAWLDAGIIAINGVWVAAGS